MNILDPLRFILIIDPDKEAVALTRQSLQDHFDSLVLNSLDNGFQLLSYMKNLSITDPEFFPDLILMEVYNPVKGGLETLKELKALPILSLVPVIMHSHSVDFKTAGAAVREGAYAVVDKNCIAERNLYIERALQIRPVTCVVR